MNSQLLKPLLIVIMLSSIHLTSSAQFTMNFHQGAVPAGKFDTVISMQFGLRIKGDTTTRYLAIKGVIVSDKEGQGGASYVYTTDRNPDISHVAASPTKSVTVYDDKGNLKENGTPDNKVIYEYPANGIVYVKHYRNDKLSTVDTLKLDAAGYIIEQDFDKIGHLKKYYKYNSKGFLIEDTGIFPDKRQTRLLYSYDDNGNLVKRVNISTYNTVTNTYTYAKFDEHHNWQVQNTYTDGKLTWVCEKRMVYHK